MPLSALALVLAAALLHALWNIVAKHSGGDQRFAFIAAVQLSVIWAPLGLWVGWGVVTLWGWREWAAVLASAIVHLLYFTTLLRGYRLADLTVVYPIARGTGPLLSATGAVLLLGERLSPLGMAGRGRRGGGRVPDRRRARRCGARRTTRRSASVCGGASATAR